MIEVNKVTKKYGSRAAVKDLSFSVKKEKWWAFWAPTVPVKPPQ